MFNKSGVFGRNETTPRRDATNPLGSTGNVPVAGSSATAGASVDAASSASTRPPARGVPPVRETAAPSLRENPSPAGSVAPAVVEKAEIGSGTGARLIVGPEVKLKGAEILDCDTLVVEGRVEATMDSRVIRIAENGSFSGKVSIDVAEIHGTFEGELIARSQLIIHSTGRVSGTIRYGKLVADEGGELCGDIHVISANDAASNRSTRTLVAAGTSSE